MKTIRFASFFWNPCLLVLVMFAGGCSGVPTKEDPSGDLARQDVGRPIRHQQMNSSSLQAQELVDAIGRVDLPRVKELLKEPIDLRATVEGKTALHFAVSAKVKDPNIFGELVRLLLSHGANLEAQDGLGRTPLLLAAQNCHRISAQGLIQLGADRKVVSSWGDTALHWAMRCLEDGQVFDDPVVDQYREDELLDILFVPGDDPNPRDWGGQTPLHWAVDFSRFDYQGAPDGETDMLAYDRAVQRQVKNIQLLLSLGADPNAKDYQGRTPLHLAAENGLDPLITLLLSIGAEPEAQDIYGLTPWMLVRLQGNEAGTTGEILKAHGAQKSLGSEANQKPNQIGSWFLRLAPLEKAGSTDAAGDEPGSCISLLPFLFDSQPIEAWRYDSCVEAKVCNQRTYPQPGPLDDDLKNQIRPEFLIAKDLPAVGMRWEDAEGYCQTRNLKAQNPHQDKVIRDRIRALRKDRLPDADPQQYVTVEFRCVKVLDPEH